MVDVSRKVNRVATLLGELASNCDSGFALAVHVRYTRPTLLYQTYAQTWGDHYSENGYMMVDPTVHWGLANVGSVDWHDLISEDVAGVIQAARNHGLNNGWTYATGPATSRSLGSVTSSVPFTTEMRSRCCAIIDEIHVLTDGFDQFPAHLQTGLRGLLQQGDHGAA